MTIEKNAKLAGYSSGTETSEDPHVLGHPLQTSVAPQESGSQPGRDSKGQSGLASNNSSPSGEGMKGTKVEHGHHATAPDDDFVMLGSDDNLQAPPQHYALPQGKATQRTEKTGSTRAGSTVAKGATNHSHEKIETHNHGDCGFVYITDEEIQRVPHDYPANLGGGLITRSGNALIRDIWQPAWQIASYLSDLAKAVPYNVKIPSNMLHTARSAVWRGAAVNNAPQSGEVYEYIPLQTMSAQDHRKTTVSSEHDSDDFFVVSKDEPSFQRHEDPAAKATNLGKPRARAANVLVGDVTQPAQQIASHSSDLGGKGTIFDALLTLRTVVGKALGIISAPGDAPESIALQTMPREENSKTEVEDSGFVVVQAGDGHPVTRYYTPSGLTAALKEQYVYAQNALVRDVVQPAQQTVSLCGAALKQLPYDLGNMIVYTQRALLTSLLQLQSAIAKALTLVPKPVTENESIPLFTTSSGRTLFTISSGRTGFNSDQEYYHNLAFKTETTAATPSIARPPNASLLAFKTETTAATPSIARPPNASLLAEIVDLTRFASLQSQKLEVFDALQKLRRDPYTQAAFLREARQPSGEGASRPVRNLELLGREQERLTKELMHLNTLLDLEEMGKQEASAGRAPTTSLAEGLVLKVDCQTLPTMMPSGLQGGDQYDEGPPTSLRLSSATLEEVASEQIASGKPSTR